MIFALFLNPENFLLFAVMAVGVYCSNLELLIIKNVLWAGDFLALDMGFIVYSFCPFL
jgi:hypothetical protein